VPGRAINALDQQIGPLLSYLYNFVRLCSKVKRPAIGATETQCSKENPDASPARHRVHRCLSFKQVAGPERSGGNHPVRHASGGKESRSNLFDACKIARHVNEPRWYQWVAAGHLRKGNPQIAAMHFRGLIEADLPERELHGAPVSAGEVAVAIKEGVAAFLRAYAPNPK
jgi:hypothetical protein